MCLAAEADVAEIEKCEVVFPWSWILIALIIVWI